MRLSDETEPMHSNESATSSSVNVPISATASRPQASAPVPISVSSTTALANAAFAMPLDSVSSGNSAQARRPRTRTSPVASHLLQGHSNAVAMRLAPAPNLMFRGGASEAMLFASAAEVGARRRDLSHILSNENLRKLAVAYEQLDDSADILQFSLPPPPPSDVARSLPPAKVVRPAAGNVAASSGRISSTGPIVIGSAPSDLSAGFASFDDDDDDDDDDNDRLRRSASGSAPAVSFEATREELECSLCFRLFYQVSRGELFLFTRTNLTEIPTHHFYSL
jgi:hypothetical protein